jgi:hypothetical protein
MSEPREHKNDRVRTASPEQLTPLGPPSCDLSPDHDSCMENALVNMEL